MYGYLVCGDLGWYCTVGYTWVSCGNVFFYVCQSWSYAEHFFSDICCWSCMILWLCGLSGLCVLLLIYPSVLVWYRWVGVLLIFAPFRFCLKGWMWFNCILTGKIARYDTRSIPKYRNRPLILHIVIKKSICYNCHRQRSKLNPNARQKPPEVASLRAFLLVAVS